jgi:hypothetical protein
MKTIEIMAGFKDIKTELRIKYPDILTLKEIHLWFRLENNLLKVHDYNSHERQIKLATYLSHSKTIDHIFLENKNRGRKLILYAGVEAAIKNEKIDDYLNGLFVAHGEFNRIF